MLLPILRERRWALVAVAVCSGAVQAAGPRLAFTIEATNADGTTTFSVPLGACDWDNAPDSVQWTLATPDLALKDAGGATVATLRSANWTGGFSPRGQVAASLSLVAGASDTTFRIRMQPSEFAPLAAADADARTWVSFSLSDTNASGRATMLALGDAGNGAFKSFYRANGVTHEYASLIYWMEVESVPGVNAGTVNANDAVPASGYAPLGAPVDAVWWEGGFSVSAGDRLSLTAGMAVDAAVDYATCAGDANGNYRFDFEDLTLLLTSFGACDGDPGYRGDVDVVDDGCVRLEDLIAHLSLFGTSCD